jgi:hypothetical protein
VFFGRVGCGVKASKIRRCRRKDDAFGFAQCLPDLILEDKSIGVIVFVVVVLDPMTWSLGSPFRFGNYDR